MDTESPLAKSGHSFQFAQLEKLPLEVHWNAGLTRQMPMVSPCYKELLGFQTRGAATCSTADPAWLVAWMVAAVLIWLLKYR